MTAPFTLKTEAPVWVLGVRGSHDPSWLPLAQGGERSHEFRIVPDSDLVYPHVTGPGMWVFECSEVDLKLGERRRFAGTWRRATDDEVIAWLRWAEASGG